MEHQAREQRNKRIDTVVFLVLLLGFSCLMGYLFYRQCTGSEQSYHSDMKAYILEMQGLDSGYSFPYPILFWVGRCFDLLFSPEMAMALATMTLNSISLVAVKWVLNKVTLKSLQEAMGKRDWAAGVLISVIAVSLFFVSMVYPPGEIYLPGIIRDYLGVFSGNPYYNATYMAARPFGILAFYQYGVLLDRYEMGCSGKWTGGTRGVDLREYFLFAGSLLLATMAKPSSTIVLVGAAGLIMLYRLIRRKLRNFKPTLWLGLCFVPTFLNLLYQYSGVFVPRDGGEGGIGFTFGKVWGRYCENIPLAIGLAVGFPILVFLLNYKELKQNSIYRFSWQIYWMGFAMAFFLYEKGFRERDFNFCWGYMYGIFFAFVGALLVLIMATTRKKHPFLLAMQWLAYGWHLICGIYYFSLIYGGAMYYSVRW
ncbi:MAG: hypothetical protein IJ335_04475 [Lachnospiraceae bacterium]|nr:hypothetical protein [Lachnospiraceae bacterium]